MSRFTIVSPSGEVQPKIFQVVPVEPKPLLLEVVRRLLERMDALDPYLYFPQRSCAFAFGRNGSPLPVGALRQLWTGYPGKSECPACKEPTLRLISYAGLFSVGGGTALCPGCGQCAGVRMGGYFRACVIWNEELAGTPFAITGGRFGDCITSDGVPLLVELGFSRPDGSIPSVAEIWGQAGSSPVSLKVPVQDDGEAEVVLDPGTAQARLTRRPGRTDPN